jgi:hypothetical protein
VEDHHELVASDPAHLVRRPDHALEQPHRLAQDLIPTRVTVLVVELLEVVQVKDEHREALPAGRGLRDGHLDEVIKVPAVVRPRQRVRERAVAELGLLLAQGQP